MLTVLKQSWMSLLLLFGSENCLWEVRIVTGKDGWTQVSLALNWKGRASILSVRLLKTHPNDQVGKWLEFSGQWSGKTNIPQWEPYYLVVRILKPSRKRGRFYNFRKWGHKIALATRNHFQFLYNLHGKLILKIIIRYYYFIYWIYFIFFTELRPQILIIIIGSEQTHCKL